MKDIHALLVQIRLMVGYADHFHFTDSFRLIK